jgi:HPt (histidine-containing phosphotransfer) domain-containing protein
MIDEPLISEYSNDPEMGDLIEEFVTGLSGTVAHLRNALAEGDVACVKRIAHQMKGAGGGYGFRALTSVGSDLENAVHGEAAITPLVLAQAEKFIATCRRAQLSLANH